MILKIKLCFLKSHSKWRFAKGQGHGKYAKLLPLLALVSITQLSKFTLTDGRKRECGNHPRIMGYFKIAFKNF